VLLSLAGPVDHSPCILLDCTVCLSVTLELCRAVGDHKKETLHNFIEDNKSEACSWLLNWSDPLVTDIILSIVLWT
jgi:hypothetical protein